MGKPSDLLKTLPEYASDALFREICDTYPDLDRARALTQDEMILHIGYVLGLLLDARRHSSGATTILGGTRYGLPTCAECRTILVCPNCDIDPAGPSARISSHAIPLSYFTHRPELYDVARQICHTLGMTWTDPRSGEIHPPPKRD